jgi:Mg2+ and Co2+ transporter CorA
MPFLDDVDTRIERDATAGILSAPAFFTIVVDAAITSYHATVDAIEADVDRLDAESLRGSASDQALSDLVHCRRRIAGLRRLLADHRSVFTALASPELRGVIEDPDEAALLAGLAARFEGALSAVEESREALLGSFDVYMSRQAQRTNEVMKVLTLTTVLLLPGSMIAGLLGMNVIVPLNKDDPLSFWIVVGAIAVLAVAIIAVARARRWL